MSVLHIPTSYHQYFEIAQTTIRNRERYMFFRDGAARRAALAAMECQAALNTQKCISESNALEAVIDALAGSLERDSHICYFDDPCDAWAA